MHVGHRAVVAVWFISVGFVYSGFAFAQVSGGSTSISHLAGHLFAGGFNCEVNEEVTESAFIAGGRLHVYGNYGEDVFLLGGVSVFGGDMLGDLFMVGGTLDVGGNIGNNLYAVGGKVQLSPAGELGGDAFIAGAYVELNGVIGGNLYANANTIRINGEIGGAVMLSAEHIILGPEARIAGPLTYSSESAPVWDTSALIVGPVTQSDMAFSATRNGYSVASLISIVGVLALTLMSALVHLVVPGMVSGAVDQVTERPLPSLGWGLVVVVGGPLAALLLLVTVIGIPVASLLGSLVALVMLIGMVVAAYWTGLRLRSFASTALQDPSLSGRVIWTLAGFAVLTATRLVPHVGDLAVSILFLLAWGAVLTELWSRFRGPAPVSPAV